MSRNVVGGHHPVLGDLVLNIEKTSWHDSTRYDLLVHWTGNVQLWIKPGSSLIVQADTQELRLTAASQDVFHDYWCEARCAYDERAYYRATESQVRAIARAQWVTVRVEGTRRSIERTFNDLNFERVREFVDRNLPS